MPPTTARGGGALFNTQRSLTHFSQGGSFPEQDGKLRNAFGLPDFIQEPNAAMKHPGYIHFSTNTGAHIPVKLRTQHCHSPCTRLPCLHVFFPGACHTAIVV